MTTPRGVLAHAAPCLGFDTATRVSSTVATRMLANGFRFCARYLSRRPPTDTPLEAALSLAEADDLLAAGLAIVPVQFGASTLVPGAELGHEVGNAAAENATAIGIPRGVTIWCDLEWKDSVHADPGATIAYAKAWRDAVTSSGYSAGLYVGPNVPLDGHTLGERLQFTSYWKSASKVPWVRPHGFQLVQGHAFVLHGIPVCPDIVAYDDALGSFSWWAPTPDAEA